MKCKTIESRHIPSNIVIAGYVQSMSDSIKAVTKLTKNSADTTDIGELYTAHEQHWHSAQQEQSQKHPK